MRTRCYLIYFPLCNHWYTLELLIKRVGCCMSRASPVMTLWMLRVLLMICVFLNNWWNDNLSMCQHCCHALLSTRKTGASTMSSSLLSERHYDHYCHCWQRSLASHTSHQDVCVFWIIRCQRCNPPTESISAYEWWAVKQSSWRPPSEISGTYTDLHANET